MCDALYRPVHFYDRAKVRGIAFACERLQRSTKVKSCVVMSRIAWRNPAHGPVRVGKVQRFFKYQPPWVSLEDDFRLHVVAVDWMKPYNCTPELNRAPVVSREVCLSCVSGNFVRAEDIIPTYICLVPTLDRRQDRWQVLHTDCSFTTKEY